MLNTDKMKGRKNNQHDYYHKNENNEHDSNHNCKASTVKANTRR